MVIDKLTGKGCALGIAGSKTIIEKLIDEGIVGRAIFKKPSQNGYNLLQYSYGIRHGSQPCLLSSQS